MPTMFHRHLLLAATALFLGLTALSGRAAAQESVLTIVFTGNTTGNYAPCPS